MFRLAQKLKHCYHALVDWQWAGNENSRRRIEDLKNAINNTRSSGVEGSMEEIDALEKELVDAYQMEE